ncbi:hypothetical protein [Streptomyces sp. NPDC056194]|uniref:hypothetical protein n=1 Tax=unclassified Streptomyces TaxID=2593676 RepID=UPI0035E1412D
MTAGDERMLDCPRCAAATPHRTYTSPAVGCAGERLVLVLHECRRCRHAAVGSTGRPTGCMPPDSGCGADRG